MRRAARPFAVVATCGSLLGCAEIMLPAPAHDSLAVFDDAWNFLDRHYALFDARTVDWDTLRAAIRPHAERARDAELAMLLDEMLRSLTDVHVSLDALGTLRRYVPPDYPRSGFDAIRLQVPGLRTSRLGRLRFGRVAEGVGYLGILSFAGPPIAAELDEAIGTMPDLTAVVVDVRSNGGGTSENARAAAGRFVGREYVYSHVRWRVGPRRSDLSGFQPRSVRPRGTRVAPCVHLLTDPAVVSAAESFVLMLRAAGARTYGDRTGGALGNPVTHELPNGWFVAAPQWQEYSADREPLEGRGIAPDVVIPLTVSDTSSQRDPVLERALADAALAEVVAVEPSRCATFSAAP